MGGPATLVSRLRGSAPVGLAMIAAAIPALPAVTSAQAAASGAPPSASMTQTAEHPVGAAVTAARFDGFVAVASADAIIWQTGFPPYLRHRRGNLRIHFIPLDQYRWPWASVTKQLVAVLVMQQVEAGRLALDAPASRYLPALAQGPAAPTLRQLLQHRGGLPNPNDSPQDATGTPSWYTTGPTGLAACLAGRTAPTTAWRYNNCDYTVLGAILERVTGRSFAQLFAERIATPLQLRDTFFATAGAHVHLPEAARPAPPLGTDPAIASARSEATSKRDALLLSRYGAAGGLIGPPRDLLAIDRALLAGRLLSASSRAELWRADPALGFMALGQWVFDAPLKGCTAPVRIVERRGAIERFQVRNILLPDRGLSIVVFTADPAFDFGEVWQRKGFSYDLLSAAACP